MPKLSYGVALRKDYLLCRIIFILVFSWTYILYLLGQKGPKRNEFSAVYQVGRDDLQFICSSCLVVSFPTNILYILYRFPFTCFLTAALLELIP